MSRHNISDELWKRLEPLVCLPRKDPLGRPSQDNRLMLNGILWILRTGAPRQHLQGEFGLWQTVYKRFNS
jgi:transposase